MIKTALFLVYYARKITSVFLGVHQTRNPLSIGWRWRFWNNNYEEIKRDEKSNHKLTAALRQIVSQLIS